MDKVEKAKILIENSMLMVIDYQKDFLLNGSLGARPNSLKTENPEQYNKEYNNLLIRQQNVTKKIIKLIKIFQTGKILYSKDEHPERHISFYSTHENELQNNIERLKKLKSCKEFPVKANIVYYRESIKDKLNDKNNEYKIFKKQYGDEINETVDENKYFTLKQELWPDHCIVYSSKRMEEVKKENPYFEDGSLLDPDVQNALDEHKGSLNYIPKGCHLNIDAYSVVNNNVGNRFSNICELLNKYIIKNVFLVGVATDFCVFNSARDISQLSSKDLKQKINVYIIDDCCIPIVEGIAHQMVQDLNLNIHFITFDEIKSKLNYQ